MAGPLVIQNLFSSCLPAVATVFVGHLNDPVLLSSVVLGGSLYNLTLSIIIGLSTGMDTLCGQAFGARNYAMIGLVLQRGVLICWLACIPITAVWFKVGHILTLIGMEPTIVLGASKYLTISSMALLATSLSNCLSRYFVSQTIVTPSTVCSILTACVCPYLNWFFVYKLDLRLEGAAIAFVLSAWTNALLMLLYAIYRHVHLHDHPQQTWFGFSLAALDPSSLHVYLRYALPAAIMMCMEWWVYEFVVLAAGSLGTFADVAVGVMGLAFQITSMSYMLPLSVGTAVATLVANELGAGHPLRAKRVVRVGVTYGVCQQLLVASTLLVFRHEVASIFTNSMEVKTAFEKLIPIVAWGGIGDGLNAIMGSVVRGCGRQSLGAVMNAVIYWGFGLPSMFFFGYKLHLGITGFWIGLASSSSMLCLFFMFVLSKFDWEEETHRAYLLVGSSADLASDDSTMGEAVGEDLVEPLLVGEGEEAERRKEKKGERERGKEEV